METNNFLVMQSYYGQVISEKSLPVIPRSTIVATINAIAIRLTINMRVQLQNYQLVQIFSELLDIENGRKEMRPNTQKIKLPINFV